MPRSPFPSTTSLGLVALGALWMLQTGCPGGETCGPAGAPTTLVAGTDQITLTYGNLEGGLNNDCPDPAAPEGIISLSIHGTQIDGTGLLTLCVPRPDRLAKEELGFGLNVAGSDIRLIDVTGTANSCTFTLDRTTPPTGTASADGLCGNGSGSAGFAFVADGALSLERTCGTTVDKVAVTLLGRVAIAQ